MKSRLTPDQRAQAEEGRVVSSIATAVRLCVKFDPVARRVRRILAKARAGARRPPPAADGLTPDFDDPGNLVEWWRARGSIEAERDRTESKQPRPKSKPKGGRR